MLGEQLLPPPQQQQQLGQELVLQQLGRLLQLLRYH
jgi:hypothetical protein